ncbi:MAG: hypothetical protein ABGX20_03410 [Bacillus sp. (in: firmicutes)]
MKPIIWLFTFVLSIFLLTACGQSKSEITARVMETSKNQIQIDVTDIFSKASEGKDLGIFLNVIVDKDTVIKNSSGEAINLDTISKGDTVTVKFINPLSTSDIKSLETPAEAKEIILEKRKKQ